MSRFEYSVDSPHAQTWVERIGKVVVNFSAIELESIHWLLQFTENKTELKQISELPFKARATQLIKQVVHRSCGPKWRKRTVRAWNDAMQLARIRNRVAHNPIVFGWRTDSEYGEPDFIGLPNLRGGVAKAKEVLLSKTVADKAVNDMATLAQVLRDLRVEWCSSRDAGRVPPVMNPPETCSNWSRRVAARFLGKVRRHFRLRK